MVLISSKLSHLRHTKKSIFDLQTLKRASKHVTNIGVGFVGGVESISAHLYNILRHPDVTLKQSRPKLESTGTGSMERGLN